jgi:hypothetical protein
MRDPEQVQRAMLRLAEQRISEAIGTGEFENLPGQGKPLPDLNEAYDELWWIKKWLRRERGGDLARTPADKPFSRLAAIETSWTPRRPQR